MQILKEIAEDAKLLDRCEAKKEERARKALAVWRSCAEHGRQALEKGGVEKDAMASTQKVLLDLTIQTMGKSSSSWRRWVEGCRNKLAQRCYS